MPNLFAFEANQFFLYFLVLLRVGGIFFTAPIISDNTVVPSLRIGLAIITTLLLFPLVPNPGIGYTSLGIWGYFFLCARELLIGLVLGFIPQVIFAAIELAGNLIGLQIGFSIANIIDPQSDVQVSILGSLKTSLAILLFLVLDVHHLTFALLAESLDTLPIGPSLSASGSVLDELVDYSSQMFLLAFKLSAPLSVIIIMTNVIMGFMARSVPQFNVFTVGFPISIGIGLIFVGLSMPYLIEALSQIFEQMQEQSVKMLRLLAS